VKWTFASCVWQEVWTLEGGLLSLRSRNSDAGYTSASPDDSQGHFARSTDPADLTGAPFPSSTEFMERIRPLAGPEAMRIRWVHEIHFGTHGEVLAERKFAVLTRSAGTGSLSAITDISRVEAALSFLERVTDRNPAATAEVRDLALLWSHGTAGVLLHEAIGHPAEMSLHPDEFPEWLEVRDIPEYDGLGQMSRDDAGNSTAPADLLLAAPSSLRRSSFRDPLMQRLSNVVCSSRSSQPLVVPERYIDVLAVAGGEYDRASDRVTLQIAAADLVEGLTRSPLFPFRFAASRSEISRSIVSAGGQTLAYPGVLCSDDGQTVPVGTFAPLLLTSPLQ